MSQQINLFNPAFRKQKKYFSAVAMAQALGLLLLGMLVLAGFVNYQVQKAGQEAAAATTQLAQTKEQLVKANAENVPRAKSKALEEEIKKSEAEVASLQKVFDILKKEDFGNTKGYSEYMRAFSRQIVSGLWLTGFGIRGAGNEIAVQGKALQPELVPAYIGRLKNEPIMHGKSFETLEMQVPQVDQIKKGDIAAAAATTERVPASYITFSVQSAGLAAEQADASGAKKQ